MLQHIVDFLTDYFTNLNVKKIFGGIIVLVGLAIIGSMSAGRGGDSTVLYAVGGILVASVGSIVIYYDIAKDKAPSNYSELEILANAQKQSQHEMPKGAIRSADRESNSKDISEK